MAATLAVLINVPLGDIGFTVLIVVLISCSWFAGLGPALVTVLSMMAYLRIVEHGVSQLLVFSPKEFLDWTAMVLIAGSVGWAGQARRRADAMLRQRAAQQLEASQEQFRLLVDGTKEYSIIMLNADGTVASWNKGAQRIKQYSAEEIVGQHFSRFYTDDDAKAGRPDLAMQIAAAQGTFEEENLRVRKDGRTFWANVVLTALKDNNGKLRGFSKVTRDVTQRKEAEANAQRLNQEAAARKAAEQYAKEIEGQKERFRVTLTSIGDAVITTDAEGRITLLNPVAEALTGWSDSEAVGQPLEVVFRAADEVTRQPIENPVSRVIETGQVVGLANHSLLFAKDGTERPIDDSAAPIREKDGRICGVVLVFRDISAKRRAERAIQEALQQLQVVTESMSAPVACCSRSLHYIWVNRAYANWVGRAPNDIIGQPLREVLGNTVFDRLLPRFDQVLSGESVRFEGEISFRSQRARWVNAVYSPIFDANGTVDGWVAVVNDTTEHKEIEAALKEADRRKSEFLATLSHELRNPLAPIQSAVQIVRRKANSDGDVQWGLGVIERQVQHLARLLEDLLDISRITYNKIELRKVDAELATILKRAIEVCRPLLEEKQHHLEVVIPAEPIPINADPTRLAQVFWNLLNNAAKYTNPSGQIALVVQRLGSEAVVSVKDNGRGLDAELTPRIFDMFSQVAPALERTQGGLGIGLALAKAFVERHGGSIEARSDGPNQGSEFIVRLPIAVNQFPPPESHTSPPAAPAALATRRVLVVDDLQDSAESLAMLLKLMKHEVRTAYDGEAALKTAASFLPNVIILDIGLPKLNGYQVAQRIRSESWGKDVLLVALTGWGQDDDKLRASESGFDHHLTKPVESSILEKLLNSNGDG